MSLVVGDIHDGRITLVADTKITYSHDDTRTRHVYENALPKLVILRDDVCVGYAGNDPIGNLQVLVEHRGCEVEHLTKVLLEVRHASFLVASLAGGLALRVVHGGQLHDRTPIGRAWVGDLRGYDVFQQRMSEWPADCDAGFKLLSSLQFLISFAPVDSIGGYHTRVMTTDEGFRFAADGTSIMPEVFNGIVRAAGEGVQLQMSTPPGGDTGTLAMRCVVGCGASIGALGYLVQPPGLGILFRHERPWVPVVRRVESIAELKALAASVGQSVVDG